MAQEATTGRTAPVPRQSQPTWLPGRRKAGRPKGLTPENEEKFLQAIRAGSSYAAAARYIGLSPRTVETWLRRGRGFGPAPATQEYVRFVRLVQQARASLHVLVTGNLVARSRVDTAAALAILRHIDPDWRDDVLMDPDVLPAAGGPARVVNVDNRHQEMNVVVLPAGDVPDFVHALLERRRAELAATPEEEQEPSIPIRVNSGPRTRLSALRTDSGPDTDDADELEVDET